MYFTTAWFDRYVRGDDDPAAARSGYLRLTAAVFGDSADVHQISQGFYDPARATAAGDPYAGNVPYSIAGMPIADRLSFYFLGKCDLSIPGTADRAESDDIRREGCHPLPEPGVGAALATGAALLTLLCRARAPR